VTPAVPVHPIEEESYRILAERIDLAGWAPGPAAVVARVVHATADPALVDALVVPDAAVAAGVAALAAGAAVLCDVEMVRAGISGAQTHCHLASTPSAGDHPSRSAAAMAAGAARFSDGALVVVGCAPTALAEACRLIERGELRPALVVGVPVGYVGAAEAKERLLELAERTGVHAIALRGERGGAAVAAAIVNALVRLAANGADPAPDSPAVLLIGHGTRSADGAAELRRFCEVVAAARPEVAVAAGYLEFMEPGVDEAVAALVAGGARQVIAVPLVLLGAGHLKDDGPAALERARRAHPGVAFSYARDLGVHPLVLGAVEARIREAQPADGPPDAVIVVGRGSSDPDANADLAKVARLLADGRGLTTAPATADGAAFATAPVLGTIEPAFVSLSRPGVPEALERCRRLGARRIAVVPYFLCTGRLVVRLAEEARAWAVEHPDVEVTVGGHIGVDERVVALAWSRYDEARGVDVTMNCDACLYRVALPGYERRGGTPVPRPSPVR
jgi:precorrin isomerase/sirohydrochlorin ferrochelatase